MEPYNNYGRHVNTTDDPPKPEPMPPSLIAEYNHTTSNAQGVTTQALNVLNYYLISLGLFVTGFGLAIPKLASGSNPYLTMVVLLAAIILISEKFKHVIFKLRFSFVHWCQKAGALRPAIFRDALLMGIIIDEYKKPEINLPSSMFVFFARIISMIIVFGMSVLVYCLVMAVNVGIWNSGADYGVGIFIALVSFPYFYFLERRYDYDSLNEIQYYFSHIGIFPPHKLSLCLSNIPTLMIILSMYPKYRLTDEYKVTQLLNSIRITCIWVGIILIGLTAYLCIGLEGMKFQSDWVVLFVVGLLFLCPCLFALKHLKRKAIEEMTGVSIAYVKYITMRTKTEMLFDEAVAVLRKGLSEDVLS